MKIKEHINLLGLKVEDKVTGFSGVVSSVCFDLYGCIQAAINPGLTKEGKIGESHWFDVNRLTIKNKKPVMNPPNFDYGPQADGAQGCAERPSQFKA